MGRKRVITKEIPDCLVEKIRAGNFLSTSCRLCNVNPATVKMIMSRAKERTPQTPLQREFVKAIDEANAFAEASAIKTLREGKYGWQSAARFLESRFPLHWAKQEKVDVKLGVSNEADMIAMVLKKSQQQELKQPVIIKEIETTKSEGYSTAINYVSNESNEVINASQE